VGGGTRLREGGHDWGRGDTTEGRGDTTVGGGTRLREGGHD
jgi:hypothetical protein